ncbi:gamma-glutamylcyclotransferase [Chthonobacter albigriseus]|uniref:gamma-glutamylcyclotransferase n=1 Tax=Chthonobacter albigriseus TaxID=1683161 RepID=UPI0015EE9C58|nr:gamma-glutamylcyclotransferase [Chthonobacter albigriseus]
MDLTLELVASTLRTIADPGPLASSASMDDGDYEAIANRLMADAEGPIEVFAYGSLLWKPAFQPSTEAPAVARGWHRAFRLRLTRWRGTPERPGLMMVLDRGGSCRGILQRLPETELRPGLLALLRREISSRTSSNLPRWISVESGGQTRRAIAFCARRDGPAYTGPLPDHEVADVLATAVGHAGSCAEYLYRTVESLERRGIRDGRLWSLQAMVARRIAAGSLMERGTER